VDIDKTTMERLTFIKYLYKTAVEQSVKSEPQCSISLLTFHDSVEFFLQLSAVYLDVSKKGITFMEYWDQLAKSHKKPSIQISQQESMRHLNDARGLLKHQGTRPSRLDIERFRASVTNFLAENTKIVFDLDFNELSLIDLVQFDRVKDKLNEAQKALNENMIEKALAYVAIAFNLLIGEYESTKTRRFGLSPFFSGKSFRDIRGKDIFRRGYNNVFYSSSSVGKHSLDESFDVEKLVDFMDTVSESMESIQYTLKLVSLGIDYRKYVKFRLYIPTFSWTLDGGPIIQKRNWGSRGLPTVEDVSFCINFIIESAIALQEFDFAIEHD